jgi:N-acetylmuramoyl-L-alanine amidase CwlA
MEVRQMLVAEKNYKIKCPNPLVPEYWTVHNTYNDASANNEVQYMILNANQVSYHYAVDDKEVVQGIPEDRNAWHAGDGGNGKGNRKSLSIEICYSKSGGERYTKAEENAVQFLAADLKKRGWGIDKVKKHEDWSGKHCPHRILDEGRWQQFLNAIQAELNKKDEVVQVKYTDKVTVPNTAYWQAESLVEEYQKRGFKCYALPLIPHKEQERTDAAPFIVETDFSHANLIKMELHQKGYTLAVWESI